MLTEKLKTIWRNAWHVPGWLRILEISNEYTTEEIHDLEIHDDEQIEIERALELSYYKNTLPKVNEAIKEFKAKIKDEIKPIRIEFLNQEIERLTNQLEVYRKSYLATGWLGRIVWDLSDPQRKRTLLKRYSFEKYLLENPESIPENLNYVDHSLTTQAMEVPFDTLLEFNKTGKAPCPFHEEKQASFTWIKSSNRGYCFGCNWKGGIVDFVMARNNLSFQDAVRSLIKI